MLSHLGEELRNPSWLSDKFIVSRWLRGIGNHSIDGTSQIPKEMRCQIICSENRFERCNPKPRVGEKDPYSLGGYGYELRTCAN